MGKKPPPGTDRERADATSRAASSNDEVTALRGMSREARIELLMKSLDATCGPAPARRREAAQIAPARHRGKD